MPVSPRTPRRRRSSVQSIASTNQSPSHRKWAHSREMSQSSFHFQESPSDAVYRPYSASRRSSHADASNELDNRANDSGNLASELAEALNEDDTAPDFRIGFEEERERSQTERDLHKNGDSDEFGGSVSAHPNTSPIGKRILLKETQKPGHRHHQSCVDSEDSGEEDALERQQGTTSQLDAQLAAIDHLVNHQDYAVSTDNSDVLQRIAQSLHDLPPQSGIENGTSRLITTHTALTTHMTHQTRAFQSLIHPLTSPLALSPGSEVIDELSPLLATLLMSIPAPNMHCLSALHSLRSVTSDLQAALTYLSDSVYMSRQKLTSASRKLRSVSEMVAALRHESEARDEAIRWIEKGEWNRRLSERECKNVCGNVVGGFEEVCKDWRQRLVAGMGAA